MKGNRRPVLSRLLLLAAGAVAFPFLFHLAGDAQVHLAVAERFADGEPFRYNPGGEMVVASTSPFWTVMLTGFFLGAGRFAPLLLKGVVVLLWLGSGYLLVRSELVKEPRSSEDPQDRMVPADAKASPPGVAGKGTRFPGRGGAWALAFLWLGHTTIVANALGGLENVLSALQLLVLFRLAARYRTEVTPGRMALLGLLWGWMILTRPDGGLFGALVLFLFFLRRRREGHSLGRLLGEAGVVALVAVLVNVPWYALQYRYTGQLVTDSSLARLYSGRQGALALLPGVLYLHPKTMVSLGTAFLPLSVGVAVVLGGWLGPGRLKPSLRTDRFAMTTAMVLVAGGVLFYTFGVGAEAFGRYFLPIFPFFFLLGVAGWQMLWPLLAGYSRALASLALVGAIVFMVGTGALDYYRRTVSGRFGSGPVLNVIYGPANRQYFSYNLDDLVRAPAQRQVATETLLAALGAEGATRIAVTEVQLRYFVDERVTVLSLDGRTSSEILPYFDPESGIPDFAGYFEAERPAYVHANQWCRTGGWLRALATSDMAENLVCRWQERLATLAPGETFSWQGRAVRVVAPEIVSIGWE